MAIYYDGVQEEKQCPVRDLTDGDDKDCLKFKVDTIADIANLPGIDTLRGGSSAFVLDRNAPQRLFFLGENGWA